MAVSIFAAQPLKAIYIVFEVVRSLFVLRVFWTVYYAIVGVPRPTWRISDAVQSHVTYNLTNIMGRTLVPFFTRDPTKAVENTSLKLSSFVSLPGVRSELVKDVAKREDVKPLPSIAGYTWPKDIRLGSKDGRVAMYLHGGAYFAMSAHEKCPTCDIIKGLLKYTDVSTVLSVEYRTTSYGPFPAQLLDALAGYAYMIETAKIDPKRIIIVGDSAGTHIALSLMRYLRDIKVLPMPGCQLLFSPYTDMSVRGVDRPNAEYDYLNVDSLWFSVDIFLGKLRNWKRTEGNLEHVTSYASPCSAKLPATKELFQGFPRTVIHYGECERLVRDAQELEKRLQLSGVKVDSICWKDAPHDPFVLYWFGTKEAKERAWREVAAIL